MSRSNMSSANERMPSSSSSSSFSYSLNSPTLTFHRGASSSSLLLSSSSNSLTTLSSPPKNRASRLSAPPSPRRQSPATTLAPPVPVPVSAGSPTVLSSPDPASAVRTARRSVQFSKQRGASVNWARPLAPNHENAPAVPPVPSLPPSSYSMRPQVAPAEVDISTPTFGDCSHRTSSAGASIASSAGDDDLPLTPRLALPPGAGPAEMRSWAVSSDLKGLGMAGVPVLSKVSTQLPTITTVPAQHPELVARGSEDSLSSDVGSLGGESTQTASSSSPSTPTRLLFVSESLDALSKPNTLDELTRLRAAASQLDLESQRLRRLKGKDPASIKRLPRKAVPIITEAELAVRPSPARRRAAVRHSLLTPSPRDGGYSFIVEPPLPVFEPPPEAPRDLPADHPFSKSSSTKETTNPAGASTSTNSNEAGEWVAQATSLAEARRIAAAKQARAKAAMKTFDNMVVSPPESASARRHAFYSQGKAAQSVIEFSPRKETSSSGWTPPPFLRSRHASGSIPTLGDKSRTSPLTSPISAHFSFKKACQSQAQPLPRTSATPASPAAPGPPVMSLPPAVPEGIPDNFPVPPVPHAHAQVSRKSSQGFLNKHKKISRLFGKNQPQATAAA